MTRGVLLDVDGTLMDGETALPGAARALLDLRARGIPFRLATNTTRRSRAAIAAALGRAGLVVSREEIVVPASLARRRILSSGRAGALLMVPEAAGEDFEGVTIDERSPGWVVLGDLGAGFTFERLNRAFHAVRAGASLLALHKNRFWHAGEPGLVLDAGPFVAALEYATGVEAEVVGKPSVGFFVLALEELGLPAEQVVFVGDSPGNDGAARAAGCRVILVRTGQFGQEPVEDSRLGGCSVIDSIADLDLP